MDNSFAIILRLIKYTTPYRSRLLIGIIAGIISGGSLFGVLHFSPQLIRPFEQSYPASTPETKVTSLTSLEKIAQKLNIAITDEKGFLTGRFMLLSIMGVPLFIFLKSIATYTNKYCLRWVGGHVVVDIRNHIFSLLQNQSLSYYSRADIGNLISRCINDTYAIDRGASTVLSDLTRAPMEILAAIAFIIYFAIINQVYILMLVMIFILPMCFLPISIMGKKIRRYTLKSFEKISDLISHLHENLTGIRVVKAFHMEREEEKRFYVVAMAYFRQVIRAMRAELLMTPLMELAGAMVICLLLFYCYTNHLMLSQIVPFAGAISFVYAPLKRLSKAYSEVQQSLAAANRIFEILDLDTALPESPTAITVENFTEAIKFNHVSMCYNPNSQLAVNDISLEIPKGRLIAVVGETGAGKTTIANLLARFYDPTSGSVTMDGIDLREIKTSALRNLIGVVTQETILFNETIYYNLTYGSPTATEADIIAAAKAANAHEFIISEPEGYQRVVGDKGFKLSGGERQRIAIARVILRNPQILILDEATSSLDTVTEQLIRDALERLMQNRTVFAIAHRLSTVKNAYRIYVLDNGRIVESGTHDELLKRNGVYSRLYTKQFA